MKIYAEVRCSTISQLPRSVDMMTKLGWKLVDSSRSDFLFLFETESTEAVNVPPSLTFAELEIIVNAHEPTNNFPPA